MQKKCKQSKPWSDFFAGAVCIWICQVLHTPQEEYYMECMWKWHWKKKNWKVYWVISVLKFVWSGFTLFPQTCLSKNFGSSWNKVTERELKQNRTSVNLFLADQGLWLSHFFLFSSRLIETIFFIANNQRCHNFCVVQMFVFLHKQHLLVTDIHCVMIILRWLWQSKCYIFESLFFIANFQKRHDICGTFFDVYVVHFLSFLNKIHLPVTDHRQAVHLNKFKDVVD